jgi:transcriptional regulator with XRE-family HTH domain
VVACATISSVVCCGQYLFAEDNIQMADRLPVGAQVRRWRLSRGLTLAAVAERSGLNLGYLSQIENDKASPSLDTLALLGTALDVPPAWFLMADAPSPVVVRASDRPVTPGPGARVEHVDGRSARDIQMLEVVAQPGQTVAAHAHPGDEHHLVLEGRFRAMQGAHEVELGPGDYLRWDGSLPHEGAIVGDQPARILIVRILPRDR